MFVVPQVSIPAPRAVVLTTGMLMEVKSTSYCFDRFVTRKKRWRGLLKIPKVNIEKVRRQLGEEIHFESPINLFSTQQLPFQEGDWVIVKLGFNSAADAYFTGVPRGRMLEIHSHHILFEKQ